MNWGYGPCENNYIIEAKYIFTDSRHALSYGVCCLMKIMLSVVERISQKSFILKAEAFFQFSAL